MHLPQPTRYPRKNKSHIHLHLIYIRIEKTPQHSLLHPKTISSPLSSPADLCARTHTPVAATGYTRVCYIHWGCSSAGVCNLPDASPSLSPRAVSHYEYARVAEDVIDKTRRPPPSCVCKDCVEGRAQCKHVCRDIGMWRGCFVEDGERYVGVFLFGI